ncbi:flavodoxin [Enterococcus sp. HY326]|uniref:flavodoxin n=1 Tax=Enterococcus sp. HY326 TaxID=2971265 RepID=UPI0022402A63|nr:flavodoxin [Enterococcus sp. HY326]
MKKKIAMMAAGLALVLAGCQTNNQDSAATGNANSEATNQSSTNNQQNSAGGTPDSLVLEDTEYGRGAASDGEDTNATEEATRILTPDANNIIIYFSRSGNSENLARMIHNENNADMLELTITEPYPADYDESVDRANQEREDEDYPEINTDIPDLAQYDTVYLGYQTWSMTLSNPMVSFLQEYGADLSGKTIYPFSTNAGYGEGDTLSRIAELAPDATIAESFSIEDENLLDNQADVVAWVNGNQ